MNERARHLQRSRPARLPLQPEPTRESTWRPSSAGGSFWDFIEDRLRCAGKPRKRPPMPLFARLWLGICVCFRVFADSAFAARIAALQALPGTLEDAPKSAATAAKPSPVPSAEVSSPRSSESALLLLGLLQREGRLIDFLEQDIVAFADADVGAAARVVHAGCRKALRQHVTVSAVRSEVEGQSVALETGFDAASVKLVGNIQGEGPFRGTLKHPGWRATELRLPTRIGDADPNILAPAEVEV